jgi:hypothetical protein
MSGVALFAISVAAYAAIPLLIAIRRTTYLMFATLVTVNVGRDVRIVRGIVLLTIGVDVTDDRVPNRVSVAMRATTFQR